MKKVDAPKLKGGHWGQAAMVGVALVMVIAVSGWFVIQPWQKLPEGIEPIKPFKLENLEGPWFEVAAPKSSIEVKEGLTDVRLFLKYSGPGGDRIPPYRDPNDPRYRIMLMGSAAGGETKFVVNTKSHLIRDWESASVVMPCFGSIPCAFHVIDFDSKNKLWMIVAGWERDQVRVFSRIPGLPGGDLSAVNAKLAALGYDANALRYENNLPPVPQMIPVLPEELPPQPKLNFPPPPADADESNENGSDTENKKD